GVRRRRHELAARALSPVPPPGGLRRVRPPRHELAARALSPVPPPGGLRRVRPPRHELAAKAPSPALPRLREGTPKGALIYCERRRHADVSGYLRDCLKYRKSGGG